VTDDPEDASPEFRRILEENERYAEVFDRSRLTAAPVSGLAVLACMDARIDVADALGLRVGDAHIIRNAGGLATEDVIRSLVVSQQLLGTQEIVVVGHTGCGLSGGSEAAIRGLVHASTGADTDLVFGVFDDLESTIREQADVLRTHPALRRVPVHAFVYEVETGRLRPVG
jgi:carbonic anhydrase